MTSGLVLAASMFRSKRSAICQCPASWQALMAALKLIKFWKMFFVDICKKRSKANDHCWLSLRTALKVALYVMMSKSTLNSGILAGSKSAICHPLFWQLLIVALKLMVFGKTLELGIEDKIPTAVSHSKPCSQALIMVLKVTTLGATLLTAMSVKRRNASCHCPALWHALKTALYAMVSGHVFTENMSNNKWSAMDQANAVAHALMLALKLTKSGTTSSATNWPSISIAHSHRPLFIQLFQKPRNMDKLSKLGSDLRIKALSKIWIDSCQVPTVPTFGRMSPTIAKHTTSWCAHGPTDN